MKILTILLSLTLTFIAEKGDEDKTRKNTDTTGFAKSPEQIQTVINRIEDFYSDEINFARKTAGIAENTKIKTIICPHDDYAYAGPVYFSVLKDLKIKTIILIGVAHKAIKYKLENTIVFETFDNWTGPYGNIKISPFRDSIINRMSPELFTINDSLHIEEHSLEALLPFLQHYNRDVEIIPILVPFSNYETMDITAGNFAKALNEICKQNKLIWGTDFAIVISNDAVHYGDEGWNGRKYDRFGTDAAGYNQAVAHEYEIIDNSLSGEISKEKIRKFINYTTEKEDFKAYKWTWCGRYSVPFGLLLSLHLNQKLKSTFLGKLIKYGTSFEIETLQVKDIGMGNTAPANPNHWVGYAGLIYY